MTEPKGFRVHPLDLLVLVLAAALAALAYAYLFRRSPVPRPVDPLLGMEIEVEFAADRPWKSEFPPRGDQVLLEDYLAAEVLDAGPAGDPTTGMRRVRLRILDRDTQKPEAMTLFRTGVYRGTRLRISSTPLKSEVEAEVVSIGGGEPGR